MTRMREMMAPRAWLLALTLAASISSRAGSFDHRVTFDNSGIWNHDVVLAIQDTLIIGTVGFGLYEGGESRIGHTDWQSIDATAGGAIIAQAGKYIFTRSRPSQTDDPHLWFQGKGNYSFPSGEVTTITSLVTPFILEYAPEHPLTYALAAIPLYVGVARVKEWGHWQTDVLASWAIGGGVGYYAHSRDSPLILSVMPNAIFVGLKTRF